MPCSRTMLLSLVFLLLIFAETASAENLLHKDTKKPGGNADVGSVLKSLDDYWLPCSAGCGGGTQKLSNKLEVERLCNMFPCPPCELQFGVRYGALCMGSSFISVLDNVATLSAPFMCQKKCTSHDKCHRFTYNRKTGDCTLLGESNIDQDGDGVVSLLTVSSRLRSAQLSNSVRPCDAPNDDYISGDKYSDCSGCGLKKGDKAKANTKGSYALLKMSHVATVRDSETFPMSMAEISIDGFPLIPVPSVVHLNMLEGMENMRTCQLFMNANIYDGDYDHCGAPFVHRSFAEISSKEECLKLLNIDGESSVHVAVFRGESRTCELLKPNIPTSKKENNHTRPSTRLSSSTLAFLSAVDSGNGCAIRERGSVLLVRNGFIEGCTTSCSVGEWSDWSSCEGVVHNGWKARQRSVVQKSVGREECPHIRETQPCKPGVDIYSSLVETVNSHLDSVEKAFTVIQDPSLTHCLLSNWSEWTVAKISNSCNCTWLPHNGSKSINRPSFIEEKSVSPFIMGSANAQLNVETRHRKILQNGIKRLGNTCNKDLKLSESRCLTCSNIIKKGSDALLAESTSSSFLDAKHSSAKAPLSSEITKPPKSSADASLKCHMGEWDPWAGCSQPCGPGQTFRARSRISGDCSSMNLSETKECQLQLCYLALPEGNDMLNTCAWRQVETDSAYDAATLGCRCPDSNEVACSVVEARHNFQNIKKDFMNFCWKYSDSSRSIPLPLTKTALADIAHPTGNSEDVVPPIREYLPLELLNSPGQVAKKVGLSNYHFVDCTGGFGFFGMDHEDKELADATRFGAVNSFCMPGAHILCKKRIAPEDEVFDRQKARLPVKVDNGVRKHGASLLSGISPHTMRLLSSNARYKNEFTNTNRKSVGLSSTALKKIDSTRKNQPVSAVEVGESSRDAVTSTIEPPFAVRNSNMEDQKKMANILQKSDEVKERMFNSMHLGLLCGGAGAGFVLCLAVLLCSRRVQRILDIKVLKDKPENIMNNTGALIDQDARGSRQAHNILAPASPPPPHEPGLVPPMTVVRATSQTPTKPGTFAPAAIY